MIISDYAVFENFSQFGNSVFFLLREAPGWQNYEGNLNVDFSSSKIGIYSD
jgi:hypothetical protein